MNKIHLLAAALPLVAGIAIATASHAQSSRSDQAYCMELSQIFFGKGGNERSNDTAIAIAQCQEGNAKVAIPVLERRARDEGYTLPPRS
jgi:hypothetical protein